MFEHETDLFNKMIMEIQAGAQSVPTGLDKKSTSVQLQRTGSSLIPGARRGGMNTMDKTKIKDLEENQERIMANQKRIDNNLRQMKLEEIRQNLKNVDVGLEQKADRSHMVEYRTTVDHQINVMTSTLKEESELNKNTRAKFESLMDGMRDQLRRVVETNNSNTSEVQEMKSQLSRFRAREASKNNFRKAMDQQ